MEARLRPEGPQTRAREVIGQQGQRGLPLAQGRASLSVCVAHPAGENSSGRSSVCGCLLSENSAWPVSLQTWTWYHP